MASAEARPGQTGQKSGQTRERTGPPQGDIRHEGGPVMVDETRLNKLQAQLPRFIAVGGAVGFGVLVLERLSQILR